MNHQHAIKITNNCSAHRAQFRSPTLPEDVLNMFHDGFIRWFWTLESIRTDDILQLLDSIIGYIEFEFWQLTFWLAEQIPQAVIGVLKVSGVAPLRENLRKNLIQPDYSRDKSHLQPVVENLVLCVIGFERVVDKFLKLVGDLSQVDSL